MKESIDALITFLESFKNNDGLVNEDFYTRINITNNRISITVHSNNGDLRESSLAKPINELSKNVIDVCEKGYHIHVSAPTYKTYDHFHTSMYRADEKRDIHELY